MAEGSSHPCDLSSNSAIEHIDEQLEFLCNVDEECVPKVGMTFLTCQEANDFYKEYAKRDGFVSKIRNSNRNKETGKIKNQLITCNREGTLNEMNELQSPIRIRSRGRPKKR
ncbi:hypothetical protein PIB30_027750 [Stylosanthes scabra]|uniref:FAR1 domain-containing protein n=1 Tax=Stylosanthes scabra TaxID=79078 RepID=A0ABU6Y9H1_9FABA|nr:hypothetical protein [Stylosanthes scabra]